MARFHATFLEFFNTGFFTFFLGLKGENFTPFHFQITIVLFFKLYYAMIQPFLQAGLGKGLC